MATVSSTAASSLDINSIVSQLMLVESRRKVLLQKEEAGFQVKLTAVGSLLSALSSFRSALDGLRGASNYQSLKATSGDASVFTATASAQATAGTYPLEVTQLARPHMLTSRAFTDLTSPIGAGTLTIQVGTAAARTVTIEGANDSLIGIKDAINKAADEVSASVINDGTGYKLLLTAKKPGAANQIKVTTEDPELSDFIYDPAGTKNMTEIQTAQSAVLKIGSLVVTKDANTLSDLIPGVTLNLHKAQPGVPLSLVLSHDTASVTANVQRFVSEFNKLAKSLRDAGGYDPATKKSGPLGGDGMIRQLENQIRSLIISAVPGLEGGINSLSQIGISTQKDGTLALDNNRFNQVLNNNYGEIVKLFARVGTASDPQIAMAQATEKTQPGTYAIFITQVATQGRLVGGEAVGSLTIEAGVNDVLDLSLNGVAGSITIAAGTYAGGGALAAELQSKINGVAAFSAAGLSARVVYDEETGKLTITSQTYGSTSVVGSIGGNAAANLGLETNESTPGLDVAGTIGGHEAGGSGQRLTGGPGSPVAGLVLTVLGGPIGSRGTFTYSLGVAETIYQRLTTWLDTSSGIIKAKTDSINATIKRITAAQEMEELRLKAKEKMIRAQFTSLQTTLDNLQGVSNFLTNQMIGLENLIKK